MQIRLRLWPALAALVACSLAPSPAADAEAPPTIEGRVLDEATGEPIPFANVGVPGAAVGTVSDERGAFVLAGAAGDSILLISAIGYETRRVLVDGFPEDGEIALASVELGFQETLTVSAKAKGKPKIFGKKYKERGFGLGFGSGLLGAEIGARIRIDGPTYLESANFVVTHTGGARFLYRVNVYDYAGGEIGENLLEQNVIIAAEQKRGTLTVDLREHGLIARDDVLLSLEWIQDDDGAGNSNVMLRGKPRRGGNLFLKLTSHMPFQGVDRLNVGFYFVGYRLD